MNATTSQKAIKKKELIRNNIYANTECAQKTIELKAYTLYRDTPQYKHLGAQPHTRTEHSPFRNATCDPIYRKFAQEFRKKTTLEYFDHTPKRHFRAWQPDYSTNL